MNLKDLKYLIVLADTKHFGQAAERCYVTQPTLSSQIKKLEESLGVTLIERTKRSVEITPMGKEIVLYAQRILEQADALKQVAETYHDPLAGSLRIGIIPTLSPYLLPLILKPLGKKFPQIKLILIEDQTTALLNKLKKHEIDAALIATKVEDHEIESRSLFNEPFWFVHPANHPLGNKANIEQPDLIDSDLLILSEGHCFADQVMEVCHIKDRANQGDMADLRATSLETLLHLISAGFGTTLLPALAIQPGLDKNRDITVRQLQLADTYRTISLVCRHSFPRKPVLEALVSVILERLPDTVKLVEKDD